MCCFKKPKNIEKKIKKNTIYPNNNTQNNKQNNTQKKCNN